MTAKELAEKLNGCEYGSETTPDIEKLAKDSGLVIVFAYSDDNTMFRGAINEEIPCWNGCEIYFDKKGVNFTDKKGRNLLTDDSQINTAELNCIKAVWCEDKRVFTGNNESYSWTYETEIPHEKFDVYEDGEPFCRGLVFSIADCK